MKTSTLMSIIIACGTIAILSSCTIGTSGKWIEPAGIYELKPRGHNRPIYKFDSTDKRTTVLRGSNSGIRFYDLNSKKVIRLYEHNNIKYKAELIRQIKNKKLTKR